MSGYECGIWVNCAEKRTNMQKVLTSLNWSVFGFNEKSHTNSRFGSVGL